MNHNIIMCTSLLLPILKVNKLGSAFFPSLKQVLQGGIYQSYFPD